MIISKTPYRISFFGGGTDYPEWFEKNRGAVLSTAINKYCYITIRYLPPFFEHKHRIVYSLIETVNRIEEIKHPVVKALLGLFKVKKGVEIHHDGDLPARSGIGSSSAFTVGMVNSLCALKGNLITKEALAELAIKVERDLLKEHVGSQDQIAVSFGGMNKIIFHSNHNFKVEPVTLPPARLRLFREHLMLVFTGFSRFASEIAADQIRNIKHRKNELTIMHKMVDEAIAILNSGKNLVEFGKLLHESWKLKRSLSKKISSAEIDSLYQDACRAGALGGKIIGAGGGGFMLLFVPPEYRARVKRKVRNLTEVKFDFDAEGSKIIYYNP